MIARAVGRDSMQKKDYISLNVPRLLAHFSNPASDWRATILAAARTQIDVLHDHGMIKSGYPRTGDLDISGQM
jgi:hypothetical protein